jgi:lipoic acid synthetase
MFAGDPERPAAARTQARPAWLKTRVPLGTRFAELKHIMADGRLNTVCEDARCPNVAECWNRGTATFMILGDVCTRSCGFCAVKTGRPAGLDLDEPRRVAEAVRAMRLRHAVVTSVNRDELPDGGSGVFAATVHAIRLAVPDCRVEVLIPDVETVPRLYRTVRPQAKYARSLRLLCDAKAAGLVAKTGFMLGLGETADEIASLLDNLRDTGVDIVTIGQYLQPTKAHLPVDRYVRPEEFDAWRREGLARGFRHVESGPLVRSSYHADEHLASPAGTDGIPQRA